MVTRICEICFEYININIDFDEHSRLCRLEQTEVLSKYFQVCDNLDPDLELQTQAKTYPEVKLTKTQKKAIRFFRKKAKLMSKATKHLLLEKLFRLGFDEDDLTILMNIVNESPVISFVPLFSLFDKFYEEPRMKNLLEVGYGKGSVNTQLRFNWESTLFNKFYDESEPIERVKYGAFNVDSNPNGVISARSYGDLFFVYNNNIKKRTTMVYGDSSGNALHQHIATPDNLINIMYYLPDKVIQSIIFKAKGLPFNYEQYPYVEAQIHGEIRLDRDVKQIIVDHNRVNIDNRLEDFCSNFDIELIVL